MTSKAVLLYMTAGSAEEAEDVAAALLTDRLVACVNILPGMRSLYVWEGAVQQDEECVVVAKSRRDLVPAITAKVAEVHSYDVPCVVALPIEDGNADFLQWIVEETAKTH